MMDSKEANAITTISKETNLQLFLPPSQSQKSSSIKLAITRKDERLEFLNIPKGLIELLQINNFTIERILEYGPSQIAEILGTDDYVAKIIVSQTTKNTSIDLISNYNF